MRNPKFVITLCLIAIVLSCNNKPREHQIVDSLRVDSAEVDFKRQKIDTNLYSEYDFDTVLKGNYTLRLKLDDTTENLFLVGNNINKKVSSCSKGLPYKNLGYKAADFKDYFVLAHSFGSGNPNYIELIKKKNGENVLEKGAIWISANEDMDILLYSKVFVPTKKDKMILYDLTKGTKEYFDFPNEFIKNPELLNDLSIDASESRSLVLHYFDDSKRKKILLKP